MIRVIKDNRFFFTVAGIWVLAGLCLLLFIRFRGFSMAGNPELRVDIMTLE